MKVCEHISSALADLNSAAHSTSSSCSCHSLGFRQQDKILYVQDADVLSARSSSSPICRKCHASPCDMVASVTPSTSGSPIHRGIEFVRILQAGLCFWTFPHQQVEPVGGSDISEERSRAPSGRSRAHCARSSGSNSGSPVKSDKVHHVITGRNTIGSGRDT